MPSRAAWSGQIEAQSLAAPAALLREAKANTRRCAGDPVFLATLAREITLTRGRELTLAYRSLVWVMPGFRTRRGARGNRVTAELCVVFVVRRKRELAASARERLPRWLLTFAEHDGLRQPFAIPTDVQDAAVYHRAQAHAAGALWADRTGWVAQPGHVAALVKLRHAAGEQVCLLSAQHVFTPFANGAALRVEHGLPVLPLDAAGLPAQAPQLAHSLPVGGLLRADERDDRPSFDVQLAELDSLAEAAARQRVPLRGISPTQPWVRSFADALLLNAEGRIQLLTPDNHAESPRRGALALTLGGMPCMAVPINYSLRSGNQRIERRVYHAELLCFKATSAKRVPLPGDSGSPIVAKRADGSLSLVGMHIGGDGQGLSWAIPAWQLFDMTTNWAQYPQGASLTLLEP